MPPVVVVAAEEDDRPSSKFPDLAQNTWLVGLFALLFSACCFLVYGFMSGYFQNDPFENEVRDSGREVRIGYIIDKRGCRIPDLSPFEASIKSYFERPEPVVCDWGTHPPLVTSDTRTIYVDPVARPHYYSDAEPVDCCWRSFSRTTNDTKDGVTYANNCHRFEEAARIDDEFVRVECKLRNGTTYRDFFAFLPRKQHVEARCRRQHRLDGKKSPGKKLSVLIVGVDAVSRLHMHRTMRRTLGHLKRLGAVELYGYTKIGDNSYPNIIPFLTGHTTTELYKLCRRNANRTYDSCQFAWNVFEARGYRTVYGEDAAWMGTFNYHKPGFRKPPTDYYMRPFWKQAEYLIGNTKKLNSKMCLGTRLIVDILLDYTRKVAEEFADEPYFGLLWQTSLTHDTLNFAYLADKPYRALLAHFEERNLMRNTALVFMSDHGIRWGDFRKTYQGRFEDSLPFIFILMPDWWKAKNPAAWKNLQDNAHKLTSPFDLYETFKDIAEPTAHVATNSSRRPARGISLFRPIPDDRTCESAGIPAHWCMCRNRLNVSLEDPIVPRLVSFVVESVNAMLRRQPQCAQLRASKLLEVNALSQETSSNGGSDDELQEEERRQSWTDYSITLETSPGGALLQASVRSSGSLMSLVDSVSRINAYGNQSACVDDNRLLLYCYCIRGKAP